MTLVEGSVLSAADLMRCKAERAAAIMVMGDRCVCVLTGRDRCVLRGPGPDATWGKGEGQKGSGGREWLRGVAVTDKDLPWHTHAHAGSRTTLLLRTWTCCSACGPSRATPSACRSPYRWVYGAQYFDEAGGGGERIN